MEPEAQKVRCVLLHLPRKVRNRQQTKKSTPGPSFSSGFGSSSGTGSGTGPNPGSSCGCLLQLWSWSKNPLPPGSQNCHMPPPSPPPTHPHAQKRVTVGQNLPKTREPKTLLRSPHHTQRPPHIGPSLFVMQSYTRDSFGALCHFTSLYLLLSVFGKMVYAALAPMVSCLALSNANFTAHWLVPLTSTLPP
mmetsp:Transcript_17710/g.31430  ORF Transcript_17710/g.31430 Transcript_17710/m.31430 type:complete len:191 (+) Transcript_17710:766-1338(+)